MAPAPWAGLAEPELAARGAELDRVLDQAIERCAAENEPWRRLLRMLRAGRAPGDIRAPPETMPSRRSTRGSTARASD
jgi:hypothetical protein